MISISSLLHLRYHFSPYSLGFRHDCDHLAHAFPHFILHGGHILVPYTRRHFTHFHASISVFLLRICTVPAVVRTCVYTDIRSSFSSFHFIFTPSATSALYSRYRTAFYPCSLLRVSLIHLVMRAVPPRRFCMFVAFCGSRYHFLAFTHFTYVVPHVRSCVMIVDQPQGTAAFLAMHLRVAHCRQVHYHFLRLVVHLRFSSFVSHFWLGIFITCIRHFVVYARFLSIPGTSQVLHCYLHFTRVPFLGTPFYVLWRPASP